MVVHLVETSEEDSFFAVVQFIGNLLVGGQGRTALAETPSSRFIQDCDILLHEGRVDKFLDKLISELDTVFGKCNSKDTQCCINVMTHIIPKLEPDLIYGAGLRLARALVYKPEHRADEKMRGLLNLYGVCERPDLQYGVLQLTLEFAKSNRSLAASLVPAVKGRTEAWVVAWKLPPEKARELYLSVAGLLKVVGDKSSMKESLKLLTSALELVQEGDKHALHQLKPFAIQATQQFLSSSDIYQCDLVDLPVVKQLQTDPQHSDLYKLLVLSLGGELTGFQSVLNNSLLDQLGLTRESAMQKMRMMALLALSSKSAHREVSYQTIQTALDINEDEVEFWVIKAVGKGLLECKMDQVEKSVICTRCNHCVFRHDEWDQLQAQIRAWRDNLTGVMKQISESRSQSITKSITSN